MNEINHKISHESDDEQVEVAVQEEDIVMAEESLSSSEEDEDPKMMNKQDLAPEDDLEKPFPPETGFWARRFQHMAKRSRLYLIVSLLVSFIISALAMTVGNFDVAVDNSGWQSRGTDISNRQTQLMMTRLYQEYLFYGGPGAWQNLQNNVQPGWESDEDDDESRRRLRTVDPFPQQKSQSNMQREIPFHVNPRLLQEASSSDLLDGCDLTWYTNWTSLVETTHLWPIWKAENSRKSILDPDMLLDLCNAESRTQAFLEQRGLCFGCEEGCLPPYSIVLFARLVIPDGTKMTCGELSEEWVSYRASTQANLVECSAGLKEVYDPNGEFEYPESCPIGYAPSMVEENFDRTARMGYTSSIFATLEDQVDDLFGAVDNFDKGSSKLTGAYDTQHEDFNALFTDAAVGRDMALACGSAVITTLAMIIHTRSPFITLLGLLQIILSFPLAYFVYTFIGGLDFFPFLNFIGVFVVFALGADNVFVATDKWKNARISHPTASNEAIASIALPDAAGAMFLTTITTAIAFFATAICPVAPIKLFAIFCGLLIVFDYLLCILLVFPTLCIYDRKLQLGTANCLVACHCCHATEGDGDEDAEDEKQSFIRRILLNYYRLLHRLRWVLLVICAVAFAICIYFATTLKLPNSADVRILDESHEFELNYAWRKLLLYDFLRKSGGSEVTVGFGLTPADTGDLNNPASWSQLVLDRSFDPSSSEAQLFLSTFCTELFEQDFADHPTDGYVCPFDSFAAWVEEQGVSSAPEEAYTQNCGGATAIPIPEENFHDCMIAWSEGAEETRVLSDNGKVRILWFSFASRVRWDSPFDDLDNEWNSIENWFNNHSSANAPNGVKNAIFSSEDFWWYDTNGQMLSTAFGAASIALGAAAVVILFSSRSFTLTIFAVITIGYVLTAVTSTLVGLGWTLGFLESVCFAILIGVSVDFVIHFTHSYSHFKGRHDRSERTKHALVMMGPSILAAAFTTVAAAVIMLFTIITFFQKFALILFMTIIQATVGSFVVFLVMADCLGPYNPTAVFDMIASKCGKRGAEEESSEGNDATQHTVAAPFPQKSDGSKSSS